jgi:hypothetical protein
LCADWCGVRDRQTDSREALTGKSASFHFHPSQSPSNMDKAGRRGEAYDNNRPPSPTNQNPHSTAPPSCSNSVTHSSDPPATAACSGPQPSIPLGGFPGAAAPTPASCSPQQRAGASTSRVIHAASDDHAGRCSSSSTSTPTAAAAAAVVASSVSSSPPPAAAAGAVTDIGAAAVPCCCCW